MGSWQQARNRSIEVRPKMRRKIGVSLAIQNSFVRVDLVPYILRRGVNFYQLLLGIDTFNLLTHYIRRTGFQEGNKFPTRKEGRKEGRDEIPLHCDRFGLSPGVVIIAVSLRRCSSWQIDW